MAAVPRALKILFVMSHAGFSRNFEWLLRQLAERGYQLDIVTERPPRREAPPVILEELVRTYSNVMLPNPPQRAADGWERAARGLRLTLDYLRYLTPPYRHAAALRRRAEERLPARLRRALALPVVRSGAGLGLVRAATRSLERSLPVSLTLRSFLQERRPDVLLITPLVELASTQTDWVRAARALSIPTVHCVASWDNLTNKGLLHAMPDLVAVWNEFQRQEAVELHGVPPGRVLVTGATAFDHWFDWSAGRMREAFCETVGLRPDRPFVLYVCSSSFIAQGEPQFVAGWIDALRGDEQLRDLGVLIRPHPQKPDEWQGVDLSRFEQVAVWPPSGANPLNHDVKSDYFDSIHHASAVMGINTSALIESAIVGRPVFTILAPEFAGTQEGTLHFHHLTTVNGGLLHVAPSFELHTEQLKEELARPGGAAKSRRFVEAFVRPYGVDEPATPRLVAAVERLATQARPRSRSESVWSHAVRVALTPGVRLLDRRLQAERRRDAEGSIERTRLARASAGPPSPRSS